MFACKQPCSCDRSCPIRARKRELFLRTGVRILPVFILTPLLTLTAPKCLATAGEGDEPAEARANFAAEVRPKTSSETGARRGGADAGADARADNAPALEESNNALALTPRDALPVFSEPPRGLLETDNQATQTARSSRCRLFNYGLCRAIRDQRVVALAAIQTAALLSDGVTTRQFLRRGYTEVDPVARVFLGSKPTWGRMAPLGAVQVIAGMWLAERMATSSHVWVRRLWWLPQIIGIAGNTAATAHNVALP